MHMLTPAFVALLLQGSLIRSQPCDGNAFYDLGSNRGDTVEHWYKGEIGFHKLLLGQPESDPWRYCVSTFEANPKWTPILKHLRDSLAPKAKASHGALHVYTDTAVSVANGTITMYIDTSAAAGGSTIVKEKTVRYGAVPTEVKAINFPELFGRETRRKSERPAGSRVIVRIDIEGAEYDIIEALFQRGLVCDRIDVMVVEFHYSKFKNSSLPADIDTQIRGRLAACGVEVWEYGGARVIGTKSYGTGGIGRTA